MAVVIRTEENVACPLINFAGCVPWFPPTDQQAGAPGGVSNGPEQQEGL